MLSDLRHNKTDLMKTDNKKANQIITGLSNYVRDTDRDQDSCPIL